MLAFLAITYQTVLLEDLFALWGQVHLVHCRLPAVGIAADFDAHSPSDDLVAEADADEADAVLREHSRRILDQRLDPGRIVERVVSCTADARQFLPARRVGRMQILT